MAAMHIDQAALDALLAAGENVLVDYWAPWCSYCMKITELYDRLAERYAGRLQVVKVNVDEHEALMQREGVTLLPTVALYRDGQQVDSVIAPDSAAMIEAMLGDLRLQEGGVKLPDHVHDMVIVGGGPAGYTAALYAARAGLDAVLVEKLGAGGQMAQSHQIDNYPGFPEGVSGIELAAQMKKQAERFGAKTLVTEVTGMALHGTVKAVETSDGVLRTRTVVIATGAQPRKLGVPEEDTLLGRGVAYCAACDGMFYRGKTVAVVGGGDTAVADALLLSRIASKVVLVHRRDTLRATKIYHKQLENTENVSFRWNSVVEELLHDDALTGLKLRNVITGETETLPCDGVFVSVGRIPANGALRGQLALDAVGYIVADETTETSIPGVYAAGDVRTKQLRQVATAVADGAMAVHRAEAYLAGA